MNCNYSHSVYFISATVDVKRNIYDLSINKYGSQIAIVENQGGYDSLKESSVRIYSVGRRKNMEDETVCISIHSSVGSLDFISFIRCLLQEEEDDELVSDDGSITDGDSVGK